MPETSSNHPNRKVTEPNYFARRVGAVVLAGVTLFGVPEIAKGAWENIKGSETPVLDEGSQGTEVITVEHGDTAWNIAKERTDDDVRPLVDAIMSQPDARNGLNPGDQLVVPITETPDNK